MFAMLFFALSVNRLCMDFGAGDSVTAYLRDRPRLTLLQKILLSLLRKPVLHTFRCRRCCYSYSAGNVCMRFCVCDAVFSSFCK